MVLQWINGLPLWISKPYNLVKGLNGHSVLGMLLSSSSTYLLLRVSVSHRVTYNEKNFCWTTIKFLFILRWTDRFPFSLSLLLSSILPPPQILFVYSPPFIILQFCFFVFLWQRDFMCIALLFLPLPKTVSRKWAY